MLLKVDHIVKCYSDAPVVKGISFCIDRNGVYGFLGPNGAGKSTTMNIITGCLAATSGAVFVDGHDIVEEPEAAKRQIGYLPEQPPLYMDMSPSEYLNFVAAARGVPASTRKKEVEHSMELTGLTPVRDRLIKHLSKGYKQRVGISQTLLGDPGIIILDEPTVGLDPRQITEIRELVRSLGQDHIVLFSSHIMQEVQAISDHIMIIARGELLVSGKPEELEKLLHKDPELKVRIRGSREKVQEILEGRQGLLELDLKEEPQGITEVHAIVTEADAFAESIFHACAAEGLPILTLEHKTLSLEEAFLQLTSDLDTYGPERKEGE